MVDTMNNRCIRLDGREASQRSLRLLPCTTAGPAGRDWHLREAKFVIDPQKNDRSIESSTPE